MGDATTLLFGLDGFRVVSVTREHRHDGEQDQKRDGVREVVVEGMEVEQACPGGFRNQDSYERRIMLNNAATAA